MLRLNKSQIQEQNRINETDTWSGKTAKVMYEKYKMLNDNYSHIEYSLELYIKFLKKSLEDYIRLNAEFTNNMEETAEALDVVSG